MKYECAMSHAEPVSELTEQQCWERLGSTEVGRLSTVVGRQPDIFPVNFVLDGPSVVFRTAEGSKLLSLTINDAVAFEADGWDSSSGWSVVIKGSAAEVTDWDDLARVERLPLRPWIPTLKLHYVRITATRISGRTFLFGPEPDRDFT